MYKTKSKAFTLIELIIVIAIIAILAVTAFLVLTKWMGKSRDSRRVSDISAINSALQLYSIDNLLLPLPDNYSGVYDTGYALARYQGNFTDNIASQLSNISKNIKDPQGSNYGYSVTYDRKQYQLRALTESTVGYQTNQVYAASLTAKMQGNYAGFVVTATGSIHALWNVPSLFLFSGTAITSGYLFTGGNNNFLQDNKTTDNIYPVQTVDVSNLYNASTSDDSVVYSNIINAYSTTNGVITNSGAIAVIQSAAGGIATSTLSATIPALTLWTAKTSLSTPRYAFGLGVLNNKIYAIGTRGTINKTTEIYDPTTNVWSAGKDMLSNRGLFSVGVVNNKLYVLGGHNGSSYLAGIDSYDPSTDTWTTKSATLSTARGRAGAGVVNNKIYMIGGFMGSSVLSTVDEYDPSTDTRTVKSSMPTAREGMAVGVVNNKIYVFGGEDYTSHVFNKIEIYDPSIDTWTTSSATMPVGRTCLSAAVVNNKIYLLGGATGRNCTSLSNRVDIYDPATDSWSTGTNMITARGRGNVGYTNNKLYFVGGSNGSVLNTVEEFGR